MISFRALIVLLLGWTGGVCAAQPNQLRVSGAELLWGGEKIVLRGVAVGDVILARKDRPLSDYKTIAQDWNANVVRLGVHPTVWKNQKRSTVLAELERQTQAALEAGLFVIIEWHAIGFPDGYSQQPDAAWRAPKDLYDSNFSLAKDFWRQVARKFGREPRVIFELWNEPVFQKDDYEDSIGQQWKKLKPYWRTLIAIIRAHSQNVILASGNCWAYRLTGIKDDLLDDANVAYSWHVYAGHDNDDADKWAAALDDLQKVRPVLVTEWGFQRDTKEHFKGTPESFGDKFLRDFLEAKNLHSVAWCWHTDWGPPLLQKDWKTPTEFGEFLQKYLKCRQAQRP